MGAVYRPGVVRVGEEARTARTANPSIVVRESIAPHGADSPFSRFSPFLPSHDTGPGVASPANRENPHRLPSLVTL
jgi:hypothetical protein